MRSTGTAGTITANLRRATTSPLHRREKGLTIGMFLPAPPHGDPPFGCFMNGHLSFQIGDKVVYPNHGVGVIEQISSRTIGPNVQKFYLLKIKASSLRVEVPFHNVEIVGLRPVVKNGEVAKILTFLTDGKCDNHADWKYRFKENSDKMRTGSLLEVAIVLKGLLLLAKEKPLSFREKKMLERALYLLVTELAIAKNAEETEIEDLLNKALFNTKLKFPEDTTDA